MKALTLPLFYLLSLLFCGQAYSADEVILSVAAKGCCNNADKKEYSRAQLQALPQASVTTTTPGPRAPMSIAASCSRRCSIPSASLPTR